MKRATPKASPARPLIPGWLILLAIPVTAVVTIWALRGKAIGASVAGAEPAMRVQAYAGGPGLTPDVMAGQGMVPQVMAPQVMAPPVIAPQMVAPQITEVPPGMGDGMQQVAVVQRGAPIIVAGSRRPHLDRGNCTTCHTVVRPNGARMPTVRSDSIMPHPYPGGLCINCHTTIPPQSGFAGVALPGVMQPMAPNPAPPEAQWKGMEVAPITALTAMQFGTPAGVNGAVVTEAEGQAAAAGVRPGDVVMGVNGASVTDVMSFNAATQNGALPAGNVQLLRGGTLLEVPIAPPAVGAAPAMGAPAPAAACAPGMVPGVQVNEDRARGAVGGVTMGAPPEPGAPVEGQNATAPF